jgi:acyl-coenzyme A thioesterase PaaI-like protein
MVAENERGTQWYPPHHPNCFGCGTDNPASLGLRMRPDADGEGVAGEVTFGERHQGAPGFAHGGVVAAALDDALGMLLMRLRRAAVTRRLEIDYERPCFIGRRYEVAAACERIDGRKLWLTSTLREGDDVVARAKGLFIVVDAEHFLQGDPNSDVARRLTKREQQLPW